MKECTGKSGIPLTPVADAACDAEGRLLCRTERHRARYRRVLPDRAATADRPTPSVPRTAARARTERLRADGFVVHDDGPYPVRGRIDESTDGG